MAAAAVDLFKKVSSPVDSEQNKLIHFESISRDLPDLTNYQMETSGNGLLRWRDFATFVLELDLAKGHEAARSGIPPPSYQASQRNLFE